ncbi:MAG: proton-translocating transhydrogenase family protein [Holosporales bacterium]|jgi:NAD(P) transhydrogenase subunit alpha|nr:proton-translocating transhydrogenase family protein [Holosporales bacterium]
MNIPAGASAIVSKADDVIENLRLITTQVHSIRAMADHVLQSTTGHSDFLTLFAVFVLACIVGYYVVWHVTPALHSPLMAVTNAISSVIIVGAVLAMGAMGASARLLSFGAILLTSVNIFGGFVITHRMLRMFKKKAPSETK